MNIDHIALQLYTVRSHTQQDMLGTLRQVAEIGYRNVEFAGYGNASVYDVRSTLDALGMRAISAHTPLNRFLDHPEQLLDELGTLGCEYAIVPSVAAARRASVEQARTLAEDLNMIGARCREAGLRFGYHNHAFEFEPLGDTTFWDILVRDTDPALVALELDVAWVDVGGHDPAELLRQLGARVPLLHVKDLAADDSNMDAPVGAGVLPWQRILEAGSTAGAQWYVVEQDHPRDPLNDVRVSFENLQTM